MAEQWDPWFHALVARRLSSMSHATPLMAATDWALHLAASPGKRMDLAQLALKQTEVMARYAGERLQAGLHRDLRHGVPVPTSDRRFRDPEWQQWPFNLMHQSFLLSQQWWTEATKGVWGVEKHHENVVGFMARQMLDMLSPGNQLLTNPVVLRRTMSEGGANLVRGMQNLVDDLQRQANGAPPAGTEAFVVGRNVAATPGKVVLSEQTARGAAQPLAQVPDLTLLLFDKRSGWQQRARLREQADAAGRYVAEVGVPPGARYELFVGSASRDLPYVQGRLMAADALGARP